MDLHKSVFALGVVARCCAGCVLCVRLLFWIVPVEAIEARGPSTTATKCELPEFLVPIRGVSNVLHACLSRVDKKDTHALWNIFYLVEFHRCEDSSPASARIKQQLNCLPPESKGEELYDSAIRIALDKSNGKPVEERCAAGREEMFLALRAGSRPALLALYEAATQGWFEGICPSEDDKRHAAEYLERAVAADIPDAQEYLALALLHKADVTALQTMDVPGPERHYRVSEDLRRPSDPRGIAAEALRLLNSAADRRHPAASWDLIRIYELGILGMRQPDLALAWAAVRSPEYDPDDGFWRVYRAADGVARKSACAKVRQISKRSTSLRFYREGIKNRFFLKCADESVFVSNEDCVTEVDMKGVETALAPLSGQYPMCGVTDSSTAASSARSVDSP